MISTVPENNMTIQDIIATIEVMRMQEEGAYKCSDYLYQQQVDVNSAHGPLSPSSAPVDAECRSKMSQWCCQVVDFCKLKRETVAIAMNYLDRYLVTESGQNLLMSRKMFQLAAMTCLYTAIKLHEPEAMDPKMVSNLSRGVYTEKQVTDMEQSILEALEWRMNPPTAMSFVRHFFDLLPAMSAEVRDEALELAKYQTEEAVHCYNFVAVNPSTIAFTAVANALEKVQRNMNAMESISRIASIDHSPIVEDVHCVSGMPRRRLSIGASSTFKPSENWGSVEGSPRSIIRH